MGPRTTPDIPRSQASGAFPHSGDPAPLAWPSPHSSHWHSQFGPSSSGIPVSPHKTHLLWLSQAATVVQLCLTARLPPALFPAIAHAFPDQLSLAAALLNFLLGAFKELVKVGHQLPGKAHTMCWHCLQEVSWAPEGCLGAPG